MNKPPLGVSPAWYVLPRRIDELAEAISRYTKHDGIMSNKEVTDLIKIWANEIIGHCETIDRIKV